MRTTECSTPTRLWRWLDSEDRAHRMESPPNLSAEWTAALERIERHQQSTIYMPTALWVLLDMFDAGQAAGGRVRFVDFEVRFSELMHRVSPSGADRAWEPFFHLARTSQVWDLFLGSEPSDAARLPGGRPKSRGQLLRIADRAQLRTSLLLEAATSEGRQTIRHNLMARLAAIGSAPAWALLEALPNAALRRARPQKKSPSRWMSSIAMPFALQSGRVTVSAQLNTGSGMPVRTLSVLASSSVTGRCRLRLMSEPVREKWAVLALTDIFLKMHCGGLWPWSSHRPVGKPAG